MESNVKLYQKILAVMKDIEYLKKDDNIQFGTTKYKAISEEKVTNTVRQSLIKHGLVILPVEQERLDEYRDKNILTTVNVKYKIVDVDTGHSETLVSSGTGADSQDKGVGKAMTYAYKYLLLRTFAIPTGDDPDKISSAELDHALEKASQGTPPPTPQQPNKTNKTKPKTNLGKALAETQDKHDISEIESYSCSECGEDISQGVHTFSEKKYGKPLCMKHQ